MASSTLRDICFDCADTQSIARFWAEVLGYRVMWDPAEDESDDSICIQPQEGGLRIWFSRVPEPKTGKNRVHIDINMPDSGEMDRLISLGARPLQEIRGEDGALWWTIMSDPEGNEFCAFPPSATSQIPS